MNFLTFGEVMSYVFYVVIALLVLLIMITVHEFGHYIVGKIFHFGINEFAIGFGPKIYSRQKKNGEVFSIRLLPLGGFCSFKGEDENDPSPSAFNNKKPYQRILVLIAGAFMNYLLALLIIASMFGFYGQSLYKVSSTLNSSDTLLKNGDIILEIEDKNVYLTTDFMKGIDGKKQGEKLKLSVLRDGKETVIYSPIQIDTNVANVEDTNSILLSLGVQELTPVKIKFGFFTTIGHSFEYSGRLAGTIFTVFKQLFTGKLGVDSMGGTITTITVTSNAIRTGGLQYLLYISSFIGVNLAVVNLLPIPALDGARVIFCLFEWITKKPVNKKVEGIIHTAGFIILMCFAVFVDLNHLF